MAPLGWETLWTTKIPGVSIAHSPDRSGRPNLVASGGRLFASIVSPGQVVAVDAETGAIQWQHRLGRPLPNRSCGSACVRDGGLVHGHVLPAGDVLYAKTPQTLYCLDARTGDERWSFCPYGEDHEWMYSAPEVAAGRLFIGDRQGWLHCLEADSGRPVWRVLTSQAENNQVNAPPLADRDVVYVANNAGLLLAYEQASGRLCWQASLDGPCSHRPSLALQAVVAYTDQSVALFDPHDGRRLMRSWNLRGRHHIAAACGTSDSVFVLLEAPNRWVRVDARGQSVAEAPAPRYPRTIRYSAASRLLYVTGYHSVEVFDPLSGATVASLSSSEILSGGPEVTSEALFVLGGRGTLRALRHPQIELDGRAG
jgi:hypothetical protein